ncbi:hypothetical protein G3I15_22465, partial [Streptomyces sp. SID10244]|nr:hypothetical protein [Streptomyces sp. SID10244]
MNPLIWVVVLSAITSGGLFAAMATGYWQSWRLLVPAIGGVVLAVMLGVVNYRDRGPLVLRGHGVECGNGARYEFGSATIGFQELKNGVPTIAFTSPEVANGRIRRVTNRLYSIDFNTL